MATRAAERKPAQPSISPRAVPQEVLYNPQSGISSEILFYTGAGASCTLTQENINWTSGGLKFQNSLIQELFIPEVDQSFTGSNGAGTQTSAVYDFAVGGLRRIFISDQQHLFRRVFIYRAVRPVR